MCAMCVVLAALTLGVVSMSWLSLLFCCCLLRVNNGIGKAGGGVGLLDIVPCWLLPVGGGRFDPYTLWPTASVYGAVIFLYNPVVFFQGRS